LRTLPVSFGSLASRPAGFTVPELVIVIVLVGILSVYAASRLAGSFASTRAFYDQLLAQTQYARKTAIAQRRAVCVHMTATDVRLYRGTATTCPGTDGVTSPTGETPFTLEVPSGTSIATPAVPFTFQFSSLGEYLTSAGATPGATLAVSVTGDGTYSFSVEPGTGYVHP